MEVQISGVSCYVSSMAWIKCVETSIGSYLQISHYGGEMWGLRVVSRVGLQAGLMACWLEMLEKVTTLYFGIIDGWRVRS